MHGSQDHLPEVEEYGIRTFVYREQRLFHPQNLQKVLDSPWPGVVRAKGLFWLATRPDHIGEISQVGATLRTSRMGLWLSSVPQSRWPKDPSAVEMMESYLDPVWGDRRQEIVFIGADPVDESWIRRELDACRVATHAFTPERWCDLADTFLTWA